MIMSAGEVIQMRHMPNHAQPEGGGVVCCCPTVARRNERHWIHVIRRDRLSSGQARGVSGNAVASRRPRANQPPSVHARVTSTATRGAIVLRVV